MNANECIKKIAMAKGVSMAELGRRIGVTRQAVYEQLKEDYAHDILFSRVETYLDALGFDIVFIEREDNEHGNH